MSSIEPPFFRRHLEPCFLGIPIDQKTPRIPRPDILWTEAITSLTELQQEYIYSPELRSNEPPPPLSASPSDPELPPIGRFLPLSPVWTCKEDHAYRRGFCYVSDFLRDPTERDRIVKVATPEQAHYQHNFNTTTQTFHPAEIPGMLRMIPGISYVVDMAGDHRRRLTIACLHTPKTLDKYGDVGPKVRHLSKRLFKVTWGDSDDNLAPIFLLPGLKHNDRSGVIKPGVADGSYSLANNVSEGQGQGTAKPATQPNTPEAVTRLAELLTILNDMWHLVVPCGVAKDEWDVNKFMSEYLNVITMGGTCPGPTSVQMNVSSLLNVISLEEAIGLIQGSWHPDKNDDLTRLTLFILLLRLPPGSDPGKFLFSRSGLFVHEFVELEPGSGLFIMFIMFKGNDPHTGLPPATARQDLADGLQNICNNVRPECHVGYVLYSGKGPSQRTIDHSFAPRLYYGPQPHEVSHKASMTNFAEHGSPALGPPAQQAQYIFRELASASWNATEATEADGNHIKLELPYHPLRDFDLIARMRSRYATLWDIASEYYIPFFKEDLRHAQRLAAQLSTQKEAPDTGSADIDDTHDTRSDQESENDPASSDITEIVQYQPERDLYIVVYMDTPNVRYRVERSVLESRCSSDLLDEFDSHTPRISEIISLDQRRRLYRIMYSHSSDEFDVTHEELEAQCSSARISWFDKDCPLALDPELTGYYHSQPGGSLQPDLDLHVPHRIVDKIQTAVAQPKLLLDDLQKTITALISRKELGAPISGSIADLCQRQGAILDHTSTSASISIESSIHELSVSARLINYCQLEQQRLDIGQYVIWWHNGCAHISLYHWFVISGPANAHALFLQGATIPPAYQPFIQHCKDYIQHASEAYEAAELISTQPSARKRRRTEPAATRVDLDEYTTRLHTFPHSHLSI
ncbi:hypothetical protein C8J56DRAFT_1066475 [Mycena floridula]|nr:hypothetical protein C8J56DRAFT_1066475 [Mycena floridula]